MTRIRIQDDSGDKEFFTIVPNYILNHSTANDQSLYLQMKRYAGEDGKCFATQETLMQKTGLGRKALKKSLDYLIGHQWIAYVGYTGGKTRPIKTYKVNNIWQQNQQYYRSNGEIPSERTVSFSRDTVQKNSKIPSKRTVEEEPVVRRSITYVQQVANDEIVKIIKLFSDVNPAYERMFSNKTERAAAARLVDRLGAAKLAKLIEALPQLNQRPYFPVVTTPFKLEQKLGDIKIFFKREKQEETAKRSKERMVDGQKQVFIEGQGWV